LNHGTNPEHAEADDEELKAAAQFQLLVDRIRKESWCPS
jgi:hypothetical protein